MDLVRPGAKLEQSKEVALAVILNGEPRDAAILRQDEGGRLHAPAAAMERWGLALRSGQESESWITLDDLPGVRYRLDASRATLVLDAEPIALRGRSWGMAATRRAMPTAPQPGGFLNYTLLAEGSDETRASALFELGAFGRSGILLSGFALSSRSLADTPEGTHRFARLDTAFRTDDPQRMRTLVLGDAINRPGSWGRPVRFGGIQYGTNFATQPQFVTAPLLATSGTAAVPSVVDVYVNRQLVSREQVPAGPFSITNIPPVTGAGEVSVVVRDPLGREQVLSRPFYASASLLRAGLDDFSFAAGPLRTSYAVDMGTYSSLLASGTWRRGLSDRVTGEVHAEAAQGIGAAGVAADWLVPDLGIVSSGAAGSGSEAGAGLLGFVGAEHLGSRFSVAARSYFATAAFRQVGADPPYESLQRLSFANLTLQLGGMGALGLAWVSQRYRGADKLDVPSATYAVPLGRAAFFSLTASRTIGSSSSTSLFAAIMIPLGPRQTSSLSAQRNRNAGAPATDELALTMQQSLPVGEGWGYRLFADSERRVQAGAAYQGSHGLYSIDAARDRNADGVRAQVAGSLGLLDGHVFAARQLTDSFAVVRAGGYEGVRVQADNQHVAVTGASGYAVVPRLRAYEENRLSIDFKGLPIDARVDTPRAVAVPYYRAGVLVDFSVRRESGVTMTVVQGSGEPVPASARVRISDRADALIVGHGGVLYVPDPPPTIEGEARWGERRCAFRTSPKPSNDPLPDLGRVTCGEWR